MQTFELEKGGVGRRPEQPRKNRTRGKVPVACEIASGVHGQMLLRTAGIGLGAW